MSRAHASAPSMTCHDPARCAHTGPKGVDSLPPYRAPCPPVSTRSTEHANVYANVCIASLRAELLAPLDVLVLCTTEGPALSEPELAALRSWLGLGF